VSPAARRLSGHPLPAAIGEPGPPIVGFEITRGQSMIGVATQIAAAIGLVAVRAPARAPARTFRQGQLGRLIRQKDLVLERPHRFTRLPAIVVQTDRMVFVRMKRFGSLAFRSKATKEFEHVLT